MEKEGNVFGATVRARKETKGIELRNEKQNEEKSAHLPNTRKIEELQKRRKWKKRAGKTRERRAESNQTEEKKKEKG